MYQFENLIITFGRYFLASFPHFQKKAPLCCSAEQALSIYGRNSYLVMYERRNSKKSYRRKVCQVKMTGTILAEAIV